MTYISNSSTHKQKCEWFGIDSIIKSQARYLKQNTTFTTKNYLQMKKYQNPDFG